MPAPAIIDGAMEPDRWFVLANGAGRSLLKTGFEGAYRAGTVHCYDPLFDVAAAAVRQPEPFEDSLRIAYRAQSGQSSSEERWLLYRLLATQRWWDQHPSSTADGQQAAEMSRLVQRYFGELYLASVAPSPGGPLCAVDIDGVLETPWLGFPSITPAGALALWALALHGYRVVLVTGRSLDDLRDRCRAYRLVGGVAEYGALVYDHKTGRVTPTLSTGDKCQLEKVRSELERLEGIHIDPAYRYAVRAYQVRSGERYGLNEETIKELLNRSGPNLVAIEGRAQTDFVTTGFDKGTGLRALARQLSTEEFAGLRPIVALAVGDTASDLPVFELASRSFAPANADEAVRRASARQSNLTIVKRPYQAGLLDATSNFLGHRAGGCATCREPSLSDDASRLLGILAAQDLSWWEKVRHLLALTMRDRKAA